MSKEQLIEYLKIKMIDFGVTQREFAERCGISAAYLSDILRYKRAPSKKLLDTLGLKAITLYIPNPEVRP